MESQYVIDLSENDPIYGASSDQFKNTFCEYVKSSAHPNYAKICEDNQQTIASMNKKNEDLQNEISTCKQRNVHLMGNICEYKEQISMYETQLSSHQNNKYVHAK